MRFGWELAAVAAFGPAACASPTLRDSWADPAARAEPFRKVLVVSVGGGIAQRRIFEGALVARLGVGATVLNLGIPQRFLAHGSREEVLDEIGLTPAKVAMRVHSSRMMATVSATRALAVAAWPARSGARSNRSGWVYTP